MNDGRCGEGGPGLLLVAHGRQFTDERHHNELQADERTRRRSDDHVEILPSREWCHVGRILLTENHFRYCSSVTCSIQSTTLPSFFSWTAMCVIAVVGVAPCQCFSPGANHTTSPGRISSTGPPQRCAQPSPEVTSRV